MVFSSQVVCICFQCVDDHILKHEIECSDPGKCTYCGNIFPSWSLEALAARVKTAFEQHFIRTSPEPSEWQYAMIRDKESVYFWERDGQPVLSVIEEMAGIPTEAASDVLALLSDNYYDDDMAKMGEESDFDPDSYYERTGSTDSRWQYEWEKFERALQTESRYFSQRAAAHLGEVFGQIDQINTWNKNPVVVEAGPGTPIEILYRARVFQSDDALKLALCRPDKELGSPPGRVAASGRMNARGISVFYGATAKKVALAEVRPPVGSDVALAAFKIIRPLRLLDLSALENVYIGGSVFDPGLEHRLSHAEFLRTLGKKMTKPVMPADQDFDYLATQAVSDFLATENNPALDGIVFESTQADGGRNVVLFHKASRVRELELPPGTELTASTVSHDEDGPYPEFCVYESISSTNSDNGIKRSNTLGHMFKNTHQDGDEQSDPRALCTLEVMLESLEVHHIYKVEVKNFSYKVGRIHHEKPKNFEPDDMI